MNKRRISAQLLLCFFMMMFLVVTVGCSSNFDEPPKKTYTITFDSQDATVAANPTSKTVECTEGSGCKVGLVGTLPTEPTMTHYAFAGWTPGPDCTGILLTPFTQVTEDITVYACFNSYTYTVTYDSQGATVAVDPTSVEVISPDYTVGKVPIPTRTGYTFAGWWTGVGGTGTEFTASTIVTASMTVYAYWVEGY